MGRGRSVWLNVDRNWIGIGELLDDDVNVSGAGVEVVIADDGGVNVVAVLPDRVNLRDLCLPCVLLPGLEPPELHEPVSRRIRRRKKPELHKPVVASRHEELLPGPEHQRIHGAVVELE